MTRTRKTRGGGTREAEADREGKRDREGEEHTSPRCPESPVKTATHTHESTCRERERTSSHRECALKQLASDMCARSRKRRRRGCAQALGRVCEAHRPEPDGLILGGREEERRLVGVKAQVVDAVPVSHQRARHPLLHQVDDPNDAQLARDCEQRVVCIWFHGPCAAEVRL
eukprot:1172633-Rhodomonas_salina.2